MTLYYWNSTARTIWPWNTLFFRNLFWFNVNKLKKIYPPGLGYYSCSLFSLGNGFPFQIQREREKEEVRVGKNSFLSWFYDLCSSIEKKKRRFIFNLKCLFMNYIRCKLLYDMNEVSYKLEIFLLRGLVFFEATCIIKVNSNYVKNFKIVCLHTGWIR